MNLSKDRALRTVRLAVRQGRRALSKRKREALGVAAMCAIAFWLGIERGLVDGSELCVAPQEWAPDPAACDCERGRSRWRYGICDEDPVDWADADLIVEAAMAGPDAAGTDGGMMLTVRRVLRGVPPEGNRMPLHPYDIERLMEETKALGGVAEGGHFLAMFRVWDTGAPQTILLRNGYYPLTGDGAAVTVHLRRNDIQLFRAGTGEPYEAPPETAPLRDFEYSLRLAERIP